ncbi:hypothetical protein G3I51_23995 [Streptomyces sp. SID9944]|nr:hypothetical protein [Streptomyces sp. SID9944]
MTDQTTDRRARYAKAMALHDGHPEWPTEYEDDERDYLRRADAAIKVADAERAVSPPVDRAALRDRIAALFRHPPGVERLGDATPGEIADAVLAVLPEPADRAAEWRAAADTVEAMNEGCSQAPPCTSCAAREDAADGLRDAARRMVDEAQQGDPDETDEQRADREETEREHAAGIHTHCGLTCEVELPTEHLRNFVIAKGYPGTKGALAELERRAAADAEAEAERQMAAVQRMRHVLEMEHVLGRTALEYRGLVLAALVGDEAAATETQADSTALLELVKDFLDPDPCAFDHHGYCQAHGYLGGEPMSCPHGRARKLLSDLDESAAGARQNGAQQTEPVAHQPRRGDQFEAWLKAQRDACFGHASSWAAVDGLLDQYRLHADTGTPLGEHVCDGRLAGDCDCLEQPAEPRCTCADAGGCFAPAGHYADCPAAGARQDGAQR